MGSVPNSPESIGVEESQRNAHSECAPWATQTALPELSPESAHLATGVAHAVDNLVHIYQAQQGWVPPVFDETEHNAAVEGYEGGVEMTSFAWRFAGNLPAAMVTGMCKELVHTACKCLECTSVELVVTVVIMEECIRRYPSILKLRTCRVLFLASLAMAIHVCNDLRFRNVDIARMMECHFCGMHGSRISAAQEQILWILNYTIPLEKRVYSTYLSALNGLANASNAIDLDAPNVFAEGTEGF